MKAKIVFTHDNGDPLLEIPDRLIAPDDPIAAFVQSREVIKFLSLPRREKLALFDALNADARILKYARDLMDQAKQQESAK